VTFTGGGSKTYDGTTVATVTESDNHFAGDDVTISSSGAHFDDKNVGTAKRVTVPAVTFGGSDLGNYTYSNSAPFFTTANITPRTLIVNFAGVNKVYDATTVAAVTESDNH